MEVTTQKMTIVKMPRKMLACVHHQGPFMANQELFNELFNQVLEWIEPAGVLGEDSEAITIYHNDPGSTPPEQHRISVGFTINDMIEIPDGFDVLEIPPGPYALGEFEINPDEYGDAWKSMMEFIGAQKVVPCIGPMYESYLNDPTQHPEGKHIVNICIHVR